MKLNALHQVLYDQFELSTHILGDHIIHIDRYDPESPVQYGLLDGDPYWAINVLTSELSPAIDGIVAKESSKEEFWKIKEEQQEKIDKLDLCLGEDGIWRTMFIEPPTKQNLITNQASA